MLESSRRDEASAIGWDLASAAFPWRHPIAARPGARKDADTDVVLVDRHCYDTFQPLPYQFATGLIETTAVITVESG